MSIRHPKNKKFLYIAAVLVLMGFFDFYMLMFVITKPHVSSGPIVLMIFVNAGVFGILAISVFVLAVQRFIQTIMQRWHGVIRDAAREANENTYRQHDTYSSGFSNHNSGNNHNQAAGRPSMSEDDLKDLYREVLKKYHPDFARGEEDKKFRTDLTAKINKAYKDKDVETLRMFR